MKLHLKKYKEPVPDWPEKGYHIMAQYDDEKIIVYQSYRKDIGQFAVENQYFGGAFSLERMTWIKPNFLWMMYRNGWGTKDNQESVLAIHLKLKAFIKYLKNAVYSSYNIRIGNMQRRMAESGERILCKITVGPGPRSFWQEIGKKSNSDWFEK